MAVHGLTVILTLYSSFILLVDQVLNKYRARTTVDMAGQMEPKKKKRVTTTFSFTERADQILSQVADHYGLSKTAWIEMTLREEARKLGLE